MTHGQESQYKFGDSLTAQPILVRRFESDMTMQRIAIVGLVQALGTVLYVALIVLLMTLVSKLGDPDREGEAVEKLLAVAFLVLFIVSACISAALVLGYPAVLALRQRIREAVALVAATVAWLVMMLASVIAIIVFLDH